jgi:CheY-like chemotaxis protein
VKQVERLLSYFLEFTLIRILAQQNHQPNSDTQSGICRRTQMMMVKRLFENGHSGSAHKGGDFMSKEILIVEDEPGVAAAIRFLMEQQGYCVRVAEKGEDALDLISTNKPHLVLLDIMLPGISGWEVCEKIRTNPDCRDIKIVFLTARRDEAEVARGLALGADAYITKPFKNDQLIASVKALLQDALEVAGK